MQVSAARYTTVTVTHAGHVYTWDEHWHASWCPPPARVAGLSQVAVAAAAEHHCAAIVDLQRPPVPPATV